MSKYLISILLIFSTILKASVELEVSARANFVPSGLYLEAGDRVEVVATGEWSAQPGIINGAQGFVQELNGCPVYSLVASIGLSFKEDIICLGNKRSFKALKSGPLFLMINDGDVSDNNGLLQVIITSNAKNISLINKYERSIGYLELTETVLLKSDYFQLYFPRQYLKEKLSNHIEALNYYDQLFKVFETFSSYTPFEGSPMVLYPSKLPTGVLMNAGQPIFYSKDIFDLYYANFNLVQINDHSFDQWGIMHEIAHNFTLSEKMQSIFTGAGAIEGWANILNVYAIESLNLRTEYNFNYFCLLLEIKETLGWRVFECFFKSIHAQDLKYFVNDKLKWSYIVSLMAKDFEQRKEIIEILRTYHIRL